MEQAHTLQSLSDDELLHQLAAILKESRRVEADLVAHIAEVDARRLYAGAACSSMHAYCTEVLHLSDAEAYLRIAAARASRRHPALLMMLRDGRLYLSGIAKLAPHLTEANRDEVLGRAAHKSKVQIEELLAELSPKPDVPAVVRKLPTPPGPAARLRPDGVVTPAPSIPVQARPTERLVPPPVVAPLAPERYKVQITASAQLRNKLERLQALMQEDLAAVIEAAVTEKLERLEAKRYAVAKAPRKSLEESDTSAKSRYLPAAVRRFVSKRDGNQCRFLDKNGKRCSERLRLEFHHDDPFGRGGDHDPSKVRLLCKTHNLLMAERYYGKDFMERYRRKDDRVSESTIVYGWAP